LSILPIVYFITRDEDTAKLVGIRAAATTTTIAIIKAVL
jgi:hypothetical protein